MASSSSSPVTLNVNDNVLTNVNVNSSSSPANGQFFDLLLHMVVEDAAVQNLLVNILLNVIVITIFT